MDGVAITKAATHPAMHALDSAGVVAVTGGSGLIGRRLLPRLQESAAEVKVLTRSREPHKGAWKEVQGDLLDALALRNLVSGADVVLHLAGIAHTDLRSEAEREFAYAVNVGGTRTLLQLSLEAGVSRFILVSSAYVYAGQHGVNLSEETQTSSEAPYAGMKLLAEGAAAAAAAQGMSVVILRPCVVYGPGVRYNLQRLLRALHHGYYLQVRGAHTSRSLASVDTVVAALLHLLLRPECVGCFNVADREPVRLEQWVNGLAERMGVRRPLALPAQLLQTIAAAGSAAAGLRMNAPFTRSTFDKLTAPFSLSVQRLAASGFNWPTSEDQVLREMIEAEFPKTR